MHTLRNRVKKLEASKLPEAISRTIRVIAGEQSQDEIDLAIKNAGIERRSSDLVILRKIVRQANEQDQDREPTPISVSCSA